jgi:hypothetical protein
VRLRQQAQATTDANGACTFTFAPVQTNQSWTGSIAIPAASASSSFVMMLDTGQHGGWGGSTPFGPVYLEQSEQAVVMALGLVPNSLYTAVFIGSQGPAGQLNPPSPAAFATTATLGPNSNLASANSATADAFFVAPVPGLQIVLGTLMLQPGVVASGFSAVSINARVGGQPFQALSCYAFDSAQPPAVVSYPQGFACDVDTGVIVAVSATLSQNWTATVTYLLQTPITPA